MSDQTDTTQLPPEPPPPRRLERPKDDRMLAGVCSGIARYFGVDPTIVRIVAVGLTLLGGAGALLYIAAFLLMPEEGAPGPALNLSARSGRGQAATVLGVIVILVAGFAAVAVAGAVIGWVLFPFAFLLLAGLFTWWLASGERPEGSAGQILARSALGVGLLILCGSLALAGAFAAGTGSGAVGAGLVIGAGVVLAVAAFVRPARWLILPALSLGLAAGFVTAAGINLDGGVGQREYSPASADQIRGKYQLGVGELVVDLRNTNLPPGDRRINVDVGVGHALLVVPDNVCVTTEGRVGMGAIDVFDSTRGGIDVDRQDSRTAPPGTPRIVLHGDVGMGLLEVAHTRSGHGGPGWRHNGADSTGNAACTVRKASTGSSLGPVG
jgi:phage shock protein PspC (stress-responsive transcriptional regulator)